MDVKEKIDFYFNVLTRYDEYINLAHTKATNIATFIVTFAIAMAGFIGWSVDFDKYKCIYTLIILLGVMFLGCVIRVYLLCMSVIKPNTINAKENNHIGESTIFYGDVDRLDCTSYVAKINVIQANQILEDLSQQVHVVAHVTNDKFSHFGKIYWWVNIALGTSLVLIIGALIAKLGA